MDDAAPVNVGNVLLIYYVHKSPCNRLHGWWARVDLSSKSPLTSMLCAVVILKLWNSPFFGKKKCFCTHVILPVIRCATAVKTSGLDHWVETRRHFFKYIYILFFFFFSLLLLFVPPLHTMHALKYHLIRLFHAAPWLEIKKYMAEQLKAGAGSKYLHLLSSLAFLFTTQLSRAWTEFIFIPT